MAQNMHFSCFVVIWCFLMIAALHAQKKKNVLLIVGDDAGFESQVYGNEVCKTPGLNALAKRGVVFDNAFTSVSSCSPSRSTILSGLPQHQNGMYGLHHSVHHFNSFDNLRSLPKVLGQHGIRTGIVGKKHVGPEDVYPFDFAATEENYSILQVGRNITFMKEKISKFFNETSQDQPFFLYIGFHDPHRGGSTHPMYGSFCEKFGNGEPGMGLIPDWHPQKYSPEEVVVPYFIQDTPATRGDIAAQYTTIGRMDQGITLFLKELENAGHLNDTLVIFTSDNGIPFPSGRTNLYNPGMAEPFIVSSPDGQEHWGQRRDNLTSLLDIVPTVLDWYGIHFHSYKLNQHRVYLTGQSLLPLVQSKVTQPSQMMSTTRDAIFASHNLHEITMYYPMRSIRTSRFHLIHNLNFKMPFNIDQDFYMSPTWQDILNRMQSGRPLPWYKTLKEYYYRQEWELFDLAHDDKEMYNVAEERAYADIFLQLQSRLLTWQNVTADPWICSPASILEFQGLYKGRPTCLPFDNGIPSIIQPNQDSRSVVMGQKSVWKSSSDVHSNSQFGGLDRNDAESVWNKLYDDDNKRTKLIFQQYVMSMDFTNIMILFCWFTCVCCYFSYRLGLHHRYKRLSSHLHV